MRITPAIPIYSLLFLCVFVSGCTRGSQDTLSGKRRTYRIGYMICNSADETLTRFRPLTAHLSRKLGVELEAVAIDTINFTRKVQNLHFTHTNSLLYIILHRYYGVDILAAEKAGSLGSRTRGAVVALKKSGIRELADLKGKTMLFGPMYAPSAYLTQLDLLLGAGISPEDDLAYYSIPSGSFKHEKVIYGTLFGAADAGAFPMLDFERMVDSGRINPDDFIVIASGEPILYCNFGATQRVDENLAAALKKELLALTSETTATVDGEVVRVLKTARINGYEAVDDQDFDPVRAMARRTNMPPYQIY